MLSLLSPRFFSVPRQSRRALLAVAVLSASLSAQTTWTGSVGTNWNLAGNWSSAAVPTAADDVVIAATANLPALFLVDPVCRDLTIDTGASMTLGGGFDLVIGGDLLLNGSMTVASGNSSIEVLGDWTNNGTFAHGGAEVDMSATGSLGGSALTTFNDLSVSGGLRSAAAAFAVDGDVVIGGAGALNLGAFVHTVAGNWVSSAVGAAVSGSGEIEFTGNGQLTTLGNSLPNVRVSAGVRSANTSTVAGDLTLTGGTLQVLDGATLSVGGDATLTAGTLGWTSTFAGAETLAVAGDVICTATAGTTSPDALFQVSGNWLSTAAFSPVSGTVVFGSAAPGTIGGASPTFANVEIGSGIRIVTSAAAIALDLTVRSGAVLSTNAALDIDGDVIMGDVTSSWAVGSVTHTVAGNWTSSGGSTSGAGQVSFDGPGTTSTGGGSLASAVHTAGVRLLQDSQFGKLSMVGGQLRIQDGATVSVVGDVTLAAGILAFDAGASGNLETLAVGNDLTVTAATSGTSTADSVISCSGNWSSGPGFAMANGFVSLDGAASTLGGAGPVFPNLLIQGGTQTLTSPAQVTRDLAVLSGSTLSCAAALDIDGDVNLGDASASWDLGALTHTVGGNFSSAGGDASGAGTVSFDGNGTVSSGAGSLARMAVTSGNRLVLDTVVLGDLNLTGGTLDIQDNQVMTVGGSASFANGALVLSDVSAGNELLDVEGDVSFSTTTVATTPNSLITCAGSWSADASFAPSAGRIELDGPGTVTLSGAPFVFDLMIHQGTTTMVLAPLAVAGDLSVNDGAVLDADAVITVGGAVSLGDGTAAWDLGTSLHTVAGDFESTGALAFGLGGIILSGSGSLSTGGGSVAALEIAAGTRTVSDAVIAGDLELSGGTLLLDDDGTMTVAGSANLHGGTLSFFPTSVGGPEVLDVQGDMTLSAIAGSMSDGSQLSCAGQWTSTAAWAPSAGTVILDGGTLTTVGGSGANFASLVIDSGVKTVTGAVSVASDLTVQDGATLDADAPLAIAGDVVLGDGSASWDLGLSTHTVSGNYSSSGASATGTGFVEFNSTGMTATGAGSISNLRVSAGLRLLNSSEITGNIEQTGGSIRVGDNALVHVLGDASFNGVVLAWNGSSDGMLDVLDVDGNVTVGASDGDVSVDAALRVGGNYSATAAFAPATGQVVLDGGTATNVSGTGLSFANLIIESGTKTLSADVLVLGDLTVDSGATLDSDAVLDVDGNVDLGDATASWDVGLATHTVAGDYSSSGGSATGAGTVHFDGFGTTNSGPGTITNVRSSAGLRVMESTEITGDLDFSGGSLRVADDALVHVAGNASLAGVVLAWEALADGVDDVLDVDGDVTLTAGDALISAESVLRVGGNYVGAAAFMPNVGRVILDSGTAATISGAGLTFADLIIESGTKTQQSGASVGDLQIVSGATLDSDASLMVSGAVALGDNTATWDLGTSTHGVGGTWTSSGGSAIGSGLVDFNGPGQLSTGAGAISNVLVSVGQRMVLDSMVSADLSMSGGVLLIADDQTLTVAGDASLLGGSLTFLNTLPGPQLIDIAGAATVSCAAGAMTAESRIECAGDWSSDAAWLPSAGTVSLDGGSVTTVAGTGLSFANLEVASGTKTVLVPMTLSADLAVLSGATLDSDGQANIAGSVTLGDATALWDLGTDTHVVDGAYTSAGASATGVGGLLLQTDDAALGTGTGSISNLSLASGDRSVSDTTVVGQLTMTGGSMTLGDDQTLTVGGDLSLVGGTLSWSPSLLGGVELIDVAGAAMITAAAGTTTANSILRVAGDWTSNSNFSPVNGLVELDGAALTTVSGAAPGFDPSFNDLVLLNGTRQIANDLTLSGASLAVTAGSELQLLNRTVTVPAGVVAVNGLMSVDGGGSLELGPTVSMLVSAAGQLNLIGDPGDPATIGGTAGGGYLLSIAGALNASNFAFEEMGSSGIVIDDTATIGAFPDDLRGGTFSYPSALPGAVMLAIERPSSAEFRYVDFQDPLDVGTSNVRTVSGASVDFVNSSGNLAGSTFELDPFGLVDWTLNLTAVSSLKGNAGLDQVQIDFVTSAEVDADSFLVQRGLGPSGPFTTLAELPATGPGVYGHLDTTVVGYTTYVYQLSQKLSHGGTMVLGQVQATPWSATLPANMTRVGPGGDHADIDSAVAALAGQFSPIVLIEGGGYPSFTIDSGLLGTLRIVPDGSGPVTIDTTGGPVVIQNLSIAESVEINDLAIGDPGSPNGGVVVQNCAGLVILDELVVSGGTSMAGVSVASSGRVAIQRTALTGLPGLAVDTGSTVIAGGGSIDSADVLGNSSLRVAGLTPGSSTVAPGSSLTSYAGVHADIDMPDVRPLDQNFLVNLSGTPNGSCFVLFSLFNSWLDLPGSSWEMVGMMDFTFGDIALTLPLGPTGQVLTTTKLPPDGVLIGVPVVFQTVVVHPSSGQRRWSNVVSLTGTP